MHLDELAVAAGDELASCACCRSSSTRSRSPTGSRWAPTDARLAAVARLDRRLGRAGRPRRADGRPLHDRGLRQDAARDDDGDDPARPAVGVRLRRLDPAGLLPRPGRHDPGRLRGDRRPLDREDQPRGPDELECVALPGKGSCASMYTANTMASVSEALGLTVPGMASPAAEDPAREEITRRAAAVLVDALENDRRPSSILTKASFENAIAVAAARRRLDERLPPPARARGRGGDRVRARRHRPHLPPHAADRRDAAGRPVHDAGPPRRGRRPRRDAGAARRRPDRRRRA